MGTATVCGSPDAQALSKEVSVVNSAAITILMDGSFGLGGCELGAQGVVVDVERGAALLLLCTSLGGGGHVGFSLLDLPFASGAGGLGILVLEIGNACGIASVVAAGKLGVVGGIAAPQHAAQGGQRQGDGRGLDPHGDDAGLDHWHTPGPQPMVLA